MKEQVKNEIDRKIDENIKYLKGLLSNNADIVIREFNSSNIKLCLIYIDGMVDKNLLNDFVLESLMFSKKCTKNIKEIKDNLLTVSEVKEVESLIEGTTAILSGDSLLLIDDSTKALVIGTRFWPTRGVTEPSSETVVRGSREGFTETVRFNTALVRRRIRDTRLKMEPLVLGVRSKSDANIVYIQDIVNNDALTILKDRVGKINIDAVLDTGNLEELIEDNIYSPFPQVQYTERPDVVAEALYEGRIALLLDNSPSAIIVPATLSNMLQSPDDYNQRWINSSLIRLIRFIAIIVSLVLPALYISVTSFNTSIIPTELAYSIAASREGVPFPAFIEAIIMEIFLALLMESVVRLPKPIGATIGIVGGLIIGQSAVSAGLVSPIMVIIVAVTAITSFLTPNYDLTSAFRLFRFILIVFSSIIGLYGVILGVLILCIHLISLKSFSIDYLAPLVNPNMQDQKDLFVRLPFKFLKERPKYMKTGDKIRQKN